MLGDVDLLQLPFPQDDDSIAHRHRLDLIVGHVDGRRADLALDAGDLGSHLDAQLGVEVRERLVHQQDPWIPDDRAAHRDPLALTAGQRSRPSRHELRQAEHARDLLDALLDLSLRDLPHPQTEGDVVGHGHVRVERVVLEHHRDVPLPRQHVVGDRVADADGPLGHVLEARDHPERRRLPTSGRSDEDHELAVAYLEAQPVHGARAVGEDLRDSVERDRCQPLPPGESLKGRGAQSSGGQRSSTIGRWLTIWHGRA